MAFILAAIRAGIQQYPALCCGEPGSDTPLNTGRGGMENKKLVFKEASATKWPYLIKAFKMFQSLFLQLSSFCEL